MSLTQSPRPQRSLKASRQNGGPSLTLASLRAGSVEISQAIKQTLV